jgi:hypothetical protein
MTTVSGGSRTIDNSNPMFGNSINQSGTFIGGSIFYT